MNIFMLLYFTTIIFIILKLAGVIAWSWWLVMGPSLVSLTVLLLIFGFAVMGVSRRWR